MTEKNELANVDLTPIVFFQPAKFEFKNLDYIKEQSKDLIEKANSLDVTEENKDKAEAWRKTLVDLVAKMSRERKDAKDKALLEFTPKANEIMDIERAMTKAAKEIKAQVDVFNEKEAQRIARERAVRIKEIIDAGVKGTKIDPDRIIWDQKWTKNATWKSIAENVEQQVAGFEAKDNEMASFKASIEMTADAFGLEPDGYVAMLGRVSLPEINDAMRTARKNREIAAEKKRLAEEAAKQVKEAPVALEEAPIILDPQEMQREAEAEIAASKPKEPAVEHKQDVTQQTKKVTKTKLIKFNDIDKDGWKKLTEFLHQNNYDFSVVEPAKK